MFLSYFFFLIFSIFCVLASLSMILAKNPVFSILFLIFTFVNTSCILFLFEFEFLPIVLLIIYVGAIAILFLFVLMTLNIKLTELKDTQSHYLPVSVALCFIFFIEIICLIKLDQDTLVFFDKNSIVFLSDLLSQESLNLYFFSLFFVNSNVKAIALTLFNKNLYAFLISGFILLLAMISTIVLTLQKNFVSKSQSVYSQLLKDYNNTLVHYN